MAKTWTDIRGLLGTIGVHNCSPTEVEFLYEASRATTGAGAIVEVGTNVGLSTISLAAGQQHKAGGRPIHTVDILAHPDIEANLCAAGVDEFVVRTVGNSSTVATRWSEPIELLLLDGDHSYRGTASDIRSWTKFVIPGGKVALHDYPGHRGSTEVWRAAYQHLLARPRQWRVSSDRSAGSLLVFERLAAPPTRSTAKEYLYWRYRDLRSSVFAVFPRLSAKIVARLKG